MKFVGFASIITSLVFFGSTCAQAQDYNSSPNNWKNNPNNWENSPNNWKNSPNNWENSPNRYGNDRIVRDEKGDPQGYAVPKEDGGLNIYDLKGKRKGYVPDPD